MAVALETFVKELTDSGIITRGKLEDFIPPKAAPKDAEELARQLVESKHLTRYQAEEVVEGRGKSLILGNYTILDRIGAGGMGQVFKAEHRRMHRVVAIKMLPATLTKDAAALARFEREVTAAAKLRHPNIVAADDADEAGGVHFLVMEYVEGKDLSALVKKNGPFSVAKAVNYVLHAARGLEFAHSEGVTHRDIKPANLLLDKKGAVKILDMGLARLDHPGGDAATQAELTGTGAVMGTVDYMAPEQALNTKHADHRADIYSLGITLWYLIAGKSAYDGETLMEKLMAHQTKPIPSLKDVQASVPDSVQAIFSKMVAKKKEDRYQSMSEVIADLERCQADVSGNALAAGAPGSSSVSATANSSSPSSSSSSSSTQESEMTAAFGSRRLQAIPAAESDEESAGKGPPRKNMKLLAGAGAAGFLFLLLGVIVIIRNKDGKEVARLDVPDASSVEVQVAAKNLLSPREGGRRPDEGAKPWNTPAFQQWMKDVAALPAEKQVEAVSKKLMELNPGFDGKVTGVDGKPTPKIESGMVTELGFVTDHVTDLSPVRALAGLKALTCSGSFVGSVRNGKLSNLSPLDGLPLTALTFNNSQVTDLSPLQGMPLTRLSCGETGVSDLSPLRGMPLTSMTCYATKVSELSPLSGMLLTSLMCNGTKVSTLSPLAGMPLASLSFSGTQVSDLSPLRGMPLSTIECDHTPVTDLSPLQGMKLTTLSFTPKNIAKGADLIRQLKSLKTIGVGWQRKDQFPSDEFWKKYDADEFGTPAAQGKRSTTLNTPAFQQWMKDVAAMPSEKQIDAVAKKLVALNPGFDGVVTGIGGKGTPKIEGGVVTELAFVTDHVTDLSPVRALAGLRVLGCNGSGIGKSHLSDLSPLGGTPLVQLLCDYTQVSDLSPLKGTKVAYLHATHTQISDLSPLQGMPLISLDFTQTQVSDLSPLHGMPLTELFCSHTQISDLSPLIGVPLRRLHCTHTPASDLSPLKGMKLTDLHCDDMPASDLSPLTGMPLTALYCHNTPVSDLSPLAGMKLTELLLTPKNVTKGLDAIRQMKSLKTIGLGWDVKEQFPPDEFWKKYDAGEFGKPGVAARPNQPWNTPAFQAWVKEVQAMPAEEQIKAVSKKLMELNPGFDGKLTNIHESGPPNVENGVVTELRFHSLHVTDVTPLRAFSKLNALICYPGGNTGSQLSDLSPLQGAPLAELRFSGTSVSDLAPLKGMPLRAVQCDHTHISDLSPLEGCKTLTTLNVAKTKVTSATVATLQKALPNCKIEWDDATSASPAAEGAKPKTPDPAASGSK